jgi:ABC-type glycerol-3-phosphate transport system substrate-binding protein
LAVELAEYLVEVQFNADWNWDAGFLPMRSGSLALWGNQSLVDTMELVSYSARPYPAQEINDVVAPIIVEAVSRVLTQGISPNEAAQTAADQLLNIEE